MFGSERRQTRMMAACTCRCFLLVLAAAVSTTTAADAVVSASSSCLGMTFGSSVMGMVRPVALLSSSSSSSSSSSLARSRGAAGASSAAAGGIGMGGESKLPAAFARSLTSLRSQRPAKVGSNARHSTMQMAQAAPTPVLKIGIFGGGTVGGGIVEILGRQSSYLTSLTGRAITVAKVCVRDASKERDFVVPDGCVVTESYDDILNDNDIDVVVEVMGGTTDAQDVVCASLRAGKDVVTANKALIAKHMREIESVLEEANEGRGADDARVEFRYEAAVCGGIPIIRSLQSDFVGDDIARISGIINGCTNFMLTSMDRDGLSYDEALAKASELGYAEADPTLDVGGFDARSKLRILMRLAYGVDVDEETIPTRGITDLTKVDFEYAKMLGGTIKLLGVTERKPNKGGSSGKTVTAFVAPCYVTADDSLSSVNGATNALEILSDNLISSTYIGQGAGRFPTANSCVNDIVAIARSDSNPMPFNPPCDPTEISVAQSYDSVFFLRLNYRDKLGITRQCGEVCEKHGVSIHSILQNPVTKRDDAAFVIMTEKVPVTSIEAVCDELEKLDWCRGPPFYMPVLREDWVQASL